MATFSPLLPILSELGLTNRTHSDILKPVGAVDVLQYLLETNLLTEDALRKAKSDILARRQEQQTILGKPKEDLQEKPDADNKSQTNIRTRHIALRIYYDGGEYSGLAENVGQANDKSVEKALFQALQKAHLVESRDTCGYSRCGRTDRGVSSAGQVVALRVKSAFGLDASLDQDGSALLQDKDLPGNGQDRLQVWVPPRAKKGISSAGDAAAIRQQRTLTEYPYDKVLNNLLPRDIRVLGWCPVSDEFSARFSAINRTYRYFFCKRLLDLDLMNQALQMLVGTHDFRNFCKMDVEKVYNFERAIYSASIEETESGICYMQIHGQAFLWHQIRCIAEVMFLVGRGKEPPTVVAQLLDVEKHPRKPSYPLADERPLVLHDCGFKNLQIGYSVQNLWAIMCLQEKQWEDLMLAASRIKNSLESLQENAIVSGDDLKAFVDRIVDARKKRKLLHGLDQLAFPFEPTERVPWRQGLEWMRENLRLVPGPNNEKELAYTPLLSRSMGTTYEEKVEAAQKSSRRKERYETNVVKKRKTKEEDSSFYNHMAAQGSFNR